MVALSGSQNRDQVVVEPNCELASGFLLRDSNRSILHMGSSHAVHVGPTLASVEHECESKPLLCGDRPMGWRLVPPPDGEPALRGRNESALNMITHDKITDDSEPGTVVVRETGHGQFQQEVISGSHRLLADEPESVGGLDSGLGPYELLLAALGACTSMTLRLYADRKKFPLTRTQVRLRHGRIYATDCAECETKSGRIDRIERIISLEGDLNAEQRAQLWKLLTNVRCTTR